jgi:hypothetical protein
MRKGLLTKHCRDRIVSGLFFCFFTGGVLLFAAKLRASRVLDHGGVENYTQGVWDMCLYLWCACHAAVMGWILLANDSLRSIIGPPLRGSMSFRRVLALLLFLSLIIGTIVGVAGVYLFV